ncbi:hypothetical protein GFY24_08940 [Nocardia sp. SYP-A9097]|uniref:hypothetical protein n=1 Tax=Nocardia sp. SYP-A9097 TaxID=2663237 RepID=UPI00129A8EFC|nr:hypothetical protein [Nocardia sp. SYP-A9097]MRH87581.1 hypothetical protein [Nocardia sp. SYP-A9097]
MTYPPGPPSGPGFGGDPNGQDGQQPENPAWWDEPAQPTQPPQPAWPADPGWQQPAAQPGWTGQQSEPAWQQPVAQPGWPGQQGYSQPQGYGAPPQPPRSDTGLVIGIALAVVAMLAVGVGAIVVLAGKDSSDQAATTTTTTEEPTLTDATTTRPTTTTKAAPAGARFTYTEYGQPWNFRLGDVALQADWVEGHDYNSCAPIEESGKLTGLGCQYASELIWKSEQGGLMLTQFILTMRDAAKASAAEGQFDDNDIKLPAGSTISHFETGKWRAGSQSEFLVITLATADTTVDEPTVEKYLRYRHTDTLGALIFR